MTSLEYLNSFVNFESKLSSLTPKEFSLSRVEELLGYLGNPQQGLTTIHVAGTKGKGSTCAFISYILATAGYKVGLYTSPHLHHVNERIRILDKGVKTSGDDFYGSITESQLASIIHDVRPHVAELMNRGIELTYFEVLTVIALIHFKNQGVDYVVLETGLGGRLDATNVIDSSVAVITPISLDHMHILGKTIAAIAKEKAGIIKDSKQQVIIAPQEPAALEVIVARCHEFGIQPIIVKDHIETVVGLKGVHQKINAMVAAKTVEALKIFGKAPMDTIAKHAIAITRWAGRLEVLRAEPLTIADGAHNHASAKALVRAIKDEYPEHGVILILGMSSDKDVHAVAGELKALASTIIVTKADHPRAYEFSRVEAGDLFYPKTWFVTANIAEAIELAQSKVASKQLILITGSLFIVAEARKISHVPV